MVLHYVVVRCMVQYIVPYIAAVCAPKTGAPPERVVASVRSKSIAMRAGASRAATAATASAAPRSMRQAAHECASHTKQRCVCSHHQLSPHAGLNGQRRAPRSAASHSQQTPRCTHSAENCPLQPRHCLLSAAWLGLGLGLGARGQGLGVRG